MLIKNSFIYLGSSILSRSIPFLLLPIMTKYLSPEEYGLLSIYLVFISIFVSLLGMNMQANISKNFYRLKKDDLSEYIGNIFFILIILFIFFQTIVFLFNRFYNELFSISFELYYLILFIALFSIINQLNLTILRNEERALMYGVFEVLNTAIKFFVTIVLLIYFYLGWYSQVYGIFFSSILFCFIAIYYMNKRGYIKLKLSIEKIKSILKISIPMIPYSLSGLVILMSDRLFIENMVDLESVGIYSVGYSFGMIVMLFTDAFIKAWSPWFYKTLKDDSIYNKEKIIKYSYLYFLGLFFITIIVSLISLFLFPYFIDNKFDGAKEFIIFIAIGFAIRGIYQIFFPYLVHISKTKFLATSMFIAAIINIIFNYIFIGYFGTIGAAYSTVIAFSVSALMMFLYQQKYYPMPWLLRRINVTQN